MNALDVDRDQMAEHLTAVTDGLPDGFGVPVVRIAKDSNRPDKVRLIGKGPATRHNIGVAVDKIAEAVDQHHIYIGTTVMTRETFQREKGCNGRGSADDSAGLIGVWSDIDIEGPGHKAEDKYPKSHEDVYAILERVLEPTYLIWSGGGFHAWWLLHEPLIFAGELDLDVAKGITRDWVQTIDHHAQALGFGIDRGVGDLARLLRLAGTRNYGKPKRPYDPPPLVEIVATGPRYRIEELLGETEVLSTEDTPQARNDADRPPLLKRRGTTSDGLGVLDAVKAAPWSDIWPSDWTEVASAVQRDGGRADLWLRPGASSEYSAVCWENACHVFSDAVAGLPSGPYSKPEVLAWRLGVSLSGLSKLLIEEART